MGQHFKRLYLNNQKSHALKRGTVGLGVRENGGVAKVSRRYRLPVTIGHFLELHPHPCQLRGITPEPTSASWNYT